MEHLNLKAIKKSFENDIEKVNFGERLRFDQVKWLIEKVEQLESDVTRLRDLNNYNLPILKNTYEEIESLKQKLEEMSEERRRLQLIYENSDLDNDAKVDNLGYVLGYDGAEEVGDPYEPTPPNEYGM